MAIQSWEWTPATSQSVRWLLYLTEGLLVGLVLSTIVLLLIELRSDIVVVVFLLPVLIWTAYLVLVERSEARAEPTPQTRFVHQWRDVRRWSWTAAIAVLVSIPIVAIEHWYLEWYETKELEITIVFVSTMLIFFSSAFFLSSRGELDTERLMLSYNADEIELESLTAAKQLTVGDRAFLWLSFDDAQNVPRFYTMPVEIAEHVKNELERTTRR